MLVNIYSAVNVKMTGSYVDKIKLQISAQILMLPSLNNGNNEIIRKNAEKTNPKLLLEPISISFLFILILKSVLFFFKLLYFY